MSKEITAVDYIQQQTNLEKEARELMPYDPNKCTYSYGPLRQNLFACLTCYEKSKNLNAICYSCSIQCHSSHELVELFTKRDFTCDCGTTRCAVNGCCKLRYTPMDNDSQVADLSVINSQRRANLNEVWKSIPADDIPSSTNEYNDNFKGIFCDCKIKYDPEQETSNMIQCNFGAVCGEDWYHEECILGIEKVVRDKKPASNARPDGVNVLDSLPEAEMAEEANGEKAEDANKVPGFPDLEAFEGFICWRCVDRYHGFFDKLQKYKDIVLESVEHSDKKVKTEEKDDEYEQVSKKQKVVTQYSLFLRDDYQAKLAKVVEQNTDSEIVEFLKEHKCLYDDDEVYEPPEDTESESGSSIFDLGTKVLDSLPREQAIEGVQAYEKVKSKLKDFLKPFAENGEVVTEEKIRIFFDGMKKL